jgi:DNA-binding NtrC family response regulator
MDSPRTLLSWIGAADLRASAADPGAREGPICQAAQALAPRRILLLSDYEAERSEQFVRWLQASTSGRIGLRCAELSSPTDFREIFHAVSALLAEIEQQRDAYPGLTYHLSPGTPAMAAVWILLAKSIFPADLIESSPERGVRFVEIPFDIAADFLPSVLEHQARSLERLSAAIPPEGARFDDIVYRSPQMQRAVERAERAAQRTVPILIEGESGTGKELLARAIHKASLRPEGPFLAVNCGAIPADLTESELFGHKKGAFTGAVQDRQGHFEAAAGGTLFLDELGELPLQTQVKLLRVLQERQVVPVGATTAVPVDARIIAATNRSLSREVLAGRFRADLFYRLAVAVIRLPALRDRDGDLSLLIDHLMGGIDLEQSFAGDGAQKVLSAEGKNFLLRQAWPGNVRELQNTLTRAAIWSSGSTITLEDVRDAMLDMPSGAQGPPDILQADLGDGFDINELLSSIARHYLTRAMQETGGNMSDAAKLLGLGSYKTVGNWIKKHGLDD